MSNKMSPLKTFAAAGALALGLGLAATPEAQAGCSNGACPTQPEQPQHPQPQPPKTPPITQAPVVNQNPVLNQTGTIIQKPVLNQTGTIIQKPVLNQTGTIIQKPEVNTVVAPVNTFKPANTVNTTVAPVNTVNTTVAPVNTVNTTVDTRDTTINTVDTRDTTIVDTRDTTTVDTRDTTTVDAGNGNGNGNGNGSQNISIQNPRQAPTVMTYATGLCPSGVGVSVAFGGFAGGLSGSKQDKFCLGVNAAGKMGDLGVQMGDIGIVATAMGSYREMFADVDAAAGIVTTNMYKECSEAAGKRSAMMLTDPNLNCQGFVTARADAAAIAAIAPVPMSFVFNITNDNDVTVEGNKTGAARKHRSTTTQTQTRQVALTCELAQAAVRDAEAVAKKVCEINPAAKAPLQSIAPALVPKH